MCVCMREGLHLRCIGVLLLDRNPAFIMNFREQTALGLPPVGLEDANPGDMSWLGILMVRVLTPFLVCLLHWLCVSGIPLSMDSMHCCAEISSGDFGFRHFLLVTENIWW